MKLTPPPTAGCSSRCCRSSGRISRTMDLSPPTIPWVSNRTGTWITADAGDRSRLLGRAAPPHRSLLQLCGNGARRARRGDARGRPGQGAVVARPHEPGVQGDPCHDPDPAPPRRAIDDVATLLAAEARLWAAGGELATERWFAGERRAPRRAAHLRVPAPAVLHRARRRRSRPRRPTICVDRGWTRSDWCWEPVWRQPRPRRDHDGAGRVAGLLRSASASGAGRRAASGRRRRWSSSAPATRSGASPTTSTSSRPSTGGWLRRARPRPRPHRPDPGSNRPPRPAG